MHNFWDSLDHLIETSNLVIDRPKGSSHPRFPDLVYPLDYGYLDGTSSCDSGGIDCWIGSSESRELNGIFVTVDSHKRDSEIKLLLGCSPDEIKIAFTCSNNDDLRAILIKREKE